MAAPEINTGDLEELAGRLAKQLNQCTRLRAFGCLSGDAEQKFLEAFIRPGSNGIVLRRVGTAGRKADCGTESG
jgi:hypothetical protein